MDNVNTPILGELWVVFVFKCSMQYTFASRNCHIMCS